MKKLKVDWQKIGGLLPVIVQDLKSGVVYMLGYMNEEALNLTISEGVVWFYSRTKKRLWMKGETSGNILKVVNLSLDCDNDTLLALVTVAGPVCHTGEKSCFKNVAEANHLENLYALIQDRKKEIPEGSYTASLFKEGVSKIGFKVIEEANEVVYAAQAQSKQRVIEETVDVLYHLFVLNVVSGVKYGEIEGEVLRRGK